MDGLNNNLETLRLAGEKDSDVEDSHQEEEEEELQPFTAQEPERAYSYQNYKALTKKNREMKLIIKQLRD